jgi:hypothetical protein
MTIEDTGSPFDEQQQKIISTVEKLMRLAARNPSAEEAAAATAKAQELLTAYNLDASLLSPDEDKSAVREKMKLKGGMYEYQRELYGAVARLNFCLYWTIVRKEWVVRNKLNKWTGVLEPRDVHSKTFQHVVVGRLVNTRSTRMMAEYIRQAIERLVNERYANNQRWMAEAVAYREGISDVVVERLNAKRYDMEREEAIKRKEAAKRSGVSTANALTIAGFSEAEKAANDDFLHGEGYTAKRAAREAEWARQRKEAEALYTAWAAANPEEARKEAEERRKQARKHVYRGGGQGSRGGMTGRERRQDSSEYWSGRKVGESLSIDQQVSDRPASAPARIGRK